MLSHMPTPNPMLILQMRRIPRLLHLMREIALNRRPARPTHQLFPHLQVHDFSPNGTGTLLAAEAFEVFAQELGPDAFHDDDEAHVVGVYFGSVVGVEGEHNRWVMLWERDVARFG